MKLISATETLAKLQGFGHEYNPQKQGYKAEIAGSYCELWDPNSRADDGGAAGVMVAAPDIEQYVAKGFLTVRPALVEPVSAGLTGAKAQRGKKEAGNG